MDQEYSADDRKKIVKHMARALWRAQRERDGMNLERSQPVWGEDREVYINLAQKALRHMKKLGLDVQIETVVAKEDA